MDVKEVSIDNGSQGHNTRLTSELKNSSTMTLTSDEEEELQDSSPLAGNASRGSCVKVCSIFTSWWCCLWSSIAALVILIVLITFGLDSFLA